MIEILMVLQKYCADSKYAKLKVSGDGLTAKRALEAIKAVACGLTEKDRLEDIFIVPEDWHEHNIMLQVNLNQSFIHYAYNLTYIWYVRSSKLDARIRS